jgi:hypothetical protein
VIKGKAEFERLACESMAHCHRRKERGGFAEKLQDSAKLRELCASAVNTLFSTPALLLFEHIIFGSDWR